MPQLWTETIVTQYFWLVVILLGFYFLAVVKFIPQIAFTLKARKALESAGSASNKVNLSGSESSQDSSLTSTKNLLSSILTPKLPVVKLDTAESIKTSIGSVRTNWINKFGQ